MHGTRDQLRPTSRRRFLMTTAVAAGTLTTSECTAIHAEDRYADLTSADYLGTLYVTCGTVLLSIRTTVPGKN